MKKLLLIAFLLSFAVFHFAQKPPTLNQKKKQGPPPRIIRTCCAFGSDLKISGIPFKRITEITELDKVGKHVFLGDKNEGNGIIYTKKGGFIDLGHLRDIADWTGYLYQQIYNGKGKKTVIDLGREGGRKTLTLNIPKNLSDKRAASLAGRIAYDLSVWHEIGTWFGTSFIPFVPERYSAFSPEDQYSNLTGANLGVLAINSEQPFELAMTGLIDNLLANLEAVDSRQKTIDAMEQIEGKWWSRDSKLPSKKVLIKRFVKADSTLLPWVINPSQVDLVPIQIPAYQDQELAKMYLIEFNLNHKFPIERIFPERKNRIITQKDFPAMMRYIEVQTDFLEVLVTKELKEKQERKEKRKEKQAKRRQQRQK